MTDEWRPGGAEGGVEDCERRAADWIVRLSDPALSAEGRAELRRECERWLAEAPEHQASYQELGRTWSLLREAALAAGTLGPSTPDASAPQARRPLPPRAEAGRSALAPTARQRHVRRLAAAAAVVLALGLARFYGGDPLLAIEADHRTAPGQARSVQLADGSRVLLGSGSAIALEGGGEEQRIRLLQGEAAFDVAPDSERGGRAFVVEAEGLAAKALGTRFQVRRDDGGTRVTVVEHLVQVSRSGDRAGGQGDATPGRTVVLGPGERLTVPADGSVELLEPVDLERATSWQRGRLVFDRQPLFEVVAELNRHRRGEIVIADAGLAGREVSGVFRIEELDGAVDRIARELGAGRLELPFVSLLY